tara:strand:- start:48 stop:305 length:258 start_codon:yes stop_codon:yes gene_type:complete
MDYLGLNYSILPVLMVHQKENQEVWFLKYLEVNNMKIRGKYKDFSFVSSVERGLNPNVNMTIRPKNKYSRIVKPKLNMSFVPRRK